MVSSVDMVITPGLMGQSIKEIGKIINIMDSVCKLGITDESMLANGIMGKWRVKALWSTKMVERTKANLRTI